MMQQLLDDRYELGSLRGSGGMATVFEAYDRTLGRRVAVKFLQPSRADGRARERFEREARAAASLMHPNAVAVYDVGEEGSSVFIVMELVEGPTLAERLARDGPLPVEEAVGIADQLLAVLGAAHRKGIVHRDVKPANVLLAPDGTAKLVDFGIAKAFGDGTPDLTATGEVLGTPRYLAPEQAAGRGATPRSDLYSLGVILYETLAGEPPFTGPSPTAVALAHQRDKVPPLARRRPGLPVALVAVVDRALAKDPARRFGSADEMRAALAEVETDPTVPTPLVEPTRTYRPAPGRAPRAARAPRRGRRRWILALLGAALAAALVALVVSELGGGGTATPRSQGLSSATTPTSTAPSTTEPPTTTPPGPTSLSDVAALLAANPEAYGPKGPELLSQLDKLLQRPDLRGPDISKLIERIQQWVRQGQLDPGIAATTTDLLRTATPTSAGGDGGD